MQNTPNTVIREKNSSSHEKRFLNNNGSKTAVKNPINEKQMTPIETFEALILP
jgi:hypothetical protein